MHLKATFLGVHKFHPIAKNPLIPKSLRTSISDHKLEERLYLACVSEFLAGCRCQTNVCWVNQCRNGMLEKITIQGIYLFDVAYRTLVLAEKVHKTLYLIKIVWLQRTETWLSVAWTPRRCVLMKSRGGQVSGTVWSASPWDTKDSGSFHVSTLVLQEGEPLGPSRWERDPHSQPWKVPSSL